MAGEEPTNAGRPVQECEVGWGEAGPGRGHACLPKLGKRPRVLLQRRRAAGTTSARRSAQRTPPAGRSAPMCEDRGATVRGGGARGVAGAAGKPKRPETVRATRARARHGRCKQRRGQRSPLPVRSEWWPLFGGEAPRTRGAAAADGGDPSSCPRGGCPIEVRPPTPKPGPHWPRPVGPMAVPGRTFKAQARAGRGSRVK